MGSDHLIQNHELSSVIILKKKVCLTPFLTSRIFILQVEEMHGYEKVGAIVVNRHLDYVKVSMAMDNEMVFKRRNKQRTITVFPLWLNYWQNTTASHTCSFPKVMFSFRENHSVG